LKILGALIFYRSMSAVPNSHEHVEQAESRPRVVGLVRLSTAEQAAEGRAGEARQEATIKAVCERENLECIEVVRIVDVSGSDMLQAVQARSILALVADGSIAGVVVDAFDRLCRTTKFADLAIL
jgi:DNA invertase Pin-like site-specific DNA recombinase